MYYDKKTEKVRSEKYYSVGYNSKLNKYMLAVVVTWIAWYVGITRYNRRDC